MNNNKIDKIFTDSGNIKRYCQLYFSNLNDTLEAISLSEIEKFIKALLDARDRGGTIYFIGNGGSAATSSHFANDIAIGTRQFDKPFKVISLCDNNAVITAIGNDKLNKRSF